MDAFEAVTEGKVEVKIKGNSMTQKYYAQHILPLHLDELDRLEAKYKQKFYFQEDNDGSHGTRSYHNPPARLKRERMAQLLWHPAQLPDLNPIESI